MASKSFEVNFDGLVGPTHNYAGLSYGNIASTSHKAAVSNPQEAALQGLAKMKRLADLGMKQGVLPPQERPDVFTLRRLGFGVGSGNPTSSGSAGKQALPREKVSAVVGKMFGKATSDAEVASDAAVLAHAAREAPEILAACSSASSMWTANAATVSPSPDTADGRVHFTPANLNNKFHRSIEHPVTGRALAAIFKDASAFAHHPALPDGAYWGDEGAANHTRFSREYGGPGIEFFVFGRYAFRAGEPEPKKFPARQSYEASKAIARLHGLSDDRVVYSQQNPDAIDAGVFHNDVISVGNRDVLFYHEKAFHKTDETLKELREKFKRVCGAEMRFVRVPVSAVSVEDAVKSYLFNSQLISPPHLEAKGEMALVAPLECQERPAVKAYLDVLVKDTSQPIREIVFMDVRQSMNNGGGPACLRLRVVLSEAEIAKANPKVFMNDALYATLCTWVKKHYRTELAADELSDPKLLQESRAALQELTQILGLGAIYPFQLQP